MAWCALTTARRAKRGDGPSFSAVDLDPVVVRVRHYDPVVFAHGQVTRAAQLIATELPHVRTILCEHLENKTTPMEK